MRPIVLVFDHSPRRDNFELAFDQRGVCSLYACVIIPAKTVHQIAYGLCDFQLSILNADDSRISVARLINYAHYTFSCKMFGHTRIYIHTNCIQWLGVHEHRGHRVCCTLTKCNYKTNQPSSGKARRGTLVRVHTVYTGARVLCKHVFAPRDP